MDQNRLRKLLADAKAKGLSHPDIPLWAQGTELERKIMQSISTTPEVEDTILRFMIGEPDFDAFNGTMLNQGRGSCRVELKTVLNWLLYTTYKFNEDIAVSAFTQYTQIEYTPIQEFLAISSIEVNNPIELVDGIRLIPFRDIPPCYVTDALDPALLKPEFLARLGISPAAFFYNSHIPPKAVFVKSAKVTPKFNQPGAFESNFLAESQELYEACECLTLVSVAAPLPIVCWVMPEEWVPCSGFTGGGWSIQPNEVIDRTLVALSYEQLQDFSAIFKKFRELDKQTRDSLRVPIQRLNQARRRRNLADKAIDLGVAFEALYLNDRSHKDQISFTFRLRAAWHLGNNQEDRKRLIEIFNKIYECRSVAVHTGNLSQSIKVKGEGKVDTKCFLDRAEAICVEAIIKIIGFGCPDWESLVLGEN